MAFNKIIIKNLHIHLEITKSNQFSIEFPNKENLDRISYHKLLNNIEIIGKDIVEVMIKIDIKKLKTLELNNVYGKIYFSGFKDELKIINSESNISLLNLSINSLSIDSISSNIDLNNFKINEMLFKSQYSVIKSYRSVFYNLTNISDCSALSFDVISSYVWNVVHSTSVRSSKVKMNVINDISLYTDYNSDHFINETKLIKKDNFYYNEKNKKTFLFFNVDNKKSIGFKNKKAKLFKHPFTFGILSRINEYKNSNNTEIKAFASDNEIDLSYFIKEEIDYQEQQMLDMVLSKYDFNTDNVFSLTKTLQDIKLIKNEKVKYLELEKLKEEILNMKNILKDLKEENYYFQNKELNTNIKKELFKIKKIDLNIKELKKTINTRKNEFNELMNILNEEYPTDLINKDNRNTIINTIEEMMDVKPEMTEKQSNNLLKLIELFNINKNVTIKSSIVF